MEQEPLKIIVDITLTNKDEVMQRLTEITDAAKALEQATKGFLAAIRTGTRAEVNHD